MKKSTSSMQLTRAADYGVRVMIYLAGTESELRLSLSDIAAATQTPESFLSKVLQTLSHAGLISSQRGQSGGFVISARGREASMLDVIEAIDGKISLNVCLVQGKSCSRKASCPAHPIWADAQHAMLHVLGAAKIATLAAQSQSIPQEHPSCQPCAHCETAQLA